MCVWVCVCMYVCVCCVLVAPWPWPCVSGPRIIRLTEFGQDVIDVSPLSLCMCLCMSVCAVKQAVDVL